MGLILTGCFKLLTMDQTKLNLVSDHFYNIGSYEFDFIIIFNIVWAIDIE